MADIDRKYYTLAQTQRKNKFSEETTIHVNLETGEAIHETRNIKSTVSAEPDFIKLYYKIMLEFKGITNVNAQFLAALCEHIPYSNDENEPVVFQATGYNKEAIAKSMDVSIDMVSKYIKAAVDAGVLVKHIKHRGAYYVNPFLIAKGAWNNIRKLQAHFSFTDGKWETDYSIVDPNETNNPILATETTTDSVVTADNEVKANE